MKQRLEPYFVLALIFNPYERKGRRLRYSLGVVNKLSYANMKSEFENPPNEPRCRVYWRWLKGMATKASITRGFCLLYTSPSPRD